ncbi:MAG TPA: hypothetical protein VMT94_03310 [Burkholderiales bacterium]|nr:hypothetical protein [Burkholderiales bacterium]
MSDDIDRQIQDSAALLNRADTLLARRKTTAATPVIPVLTEAVGAAADAIPTLTDVATPGPAPTPAPAGESPVTQPAPSSLEQAVYRKLKSQFEQEIAALPSPPAEIVAALDQALQKFSGELKTDIEAMVRSAVAETLSHGTQPSDAAAGAPRDPQTPRQ